jgi:predicted metalloendopeptidase
MKTAFSALALALFSMTAATAAPNAGIDTQYFDKSVRPQDDLYRATNGLWLKDTAIPADRSNYGAFTALDDLSQERLRAIIETAAQAPTGANQQVGALYTDFMNEAALNALGLAPLQDELAMAQALSSKRDLASYYAHLAQIGVRVPLVPYVHQDAKDSSQYTVDFFQYGLGLPDRDYYLSKDKKFVDTKAAYQKHIEKVLGMAGIKAAKAKAAAIVAFESQIAAAQWTKVESRDAVKTYNPKTRAELAKLMPSFDWDTYLNILGAGKVKGVVVSQPSYVSKLDGILQRTSLDTLRAYSAFHLIAAYSPYLSKAYVDADFAFFGTVLNGTPENRPRWKRGVEVVETTLGEAVGKIYVEKYFPAANKARMEQLVQNLMVAYEQSINSLVWMSPETQKAAKVKLSKFTYKIGYPNQWRDYSALTIKSGDLVGNLMRAAIFESNRQFAKLGQPVNREEWEMTPQTVNAYYNPEKNEIVFPAAILQPPFFNMEADDAVNYGGIGAVIGHEISHGFDDQGSRYDGDGNLKDWWTKQDRQNFEARANLLIKQYDAYEPLPAQKVNGALTIGENIADLGGLTIALRAYQLSLKGQPALTLDGMTGDQRFFKGWAQVWRRKYRDANLLQRLKTDPHSPSEYRANGVVVNVPGFYNAFGLQPSDKLFKPEKERITIW